MFDKEKIRGILENPPENNPYLHDQLKRWFDEFCANEKKLTAVTGLQKELDQKEKENLELERKLDALKKSLQTHRDAIAESRRKEEEINSGVRNQIQTIEKQLDKLAEESLPFIKKMELDRELEALKEEVKNKKSEIECFSPEENSDMLLSQRLLPFVDELGKMEEQMSRLIGEFWKDLPKDSFDE